MAWIAVGMAAVGATSSYMNNQAKKKQEQANMMANSEAMRYSPWTGNKPQMMSSTAGSDIGATLGGGMQGAMIGSQLSNMHSKLAAPDGGNISAPPGDMNQSAKMEMPNMGGGAPQTPSPLGGNEMAQNLQSPTMPNPQDMAQMRAAGQMGPGSMGSPWTPMANNAPQLKKPNMYGSY